MFRENAHHVDNFSIKRVDIFTRKQKVYIFLGLKLN